MTWPEADRKLAAALLLAMDYGGRPVEHVASVLDREIADRAVVPTWLIDASLLRQADCVRIDVQTFNLRPKIARKVSHQSARSAAEVYKPRYLFGAKALDYKVDVIEGC